MKTLFTLILIAFSIKSLSQNTYSDWNKKLKDDLNLQKLKALDIIAKKRIETNNYNGDLKLLKGITKECAADEVKFTKCLKKLGFHKAEEYSKSIFDMQKLMLVFRKENPVFLSLKRSFR